MTKHDTHQGFAAMAGAAAVLFCASTALGQDGGAGKRPTAAEASNLGFHLGLGPTVLVPTDNGPWGGGLTLHGRYGFDVGPAILGPGARGSGYYISRRFIGTAMPTLRVTLPVGPLAPFGVGGVGWGWLSNPADDGLAYMAGGGLMIHLGRLVAIGGEVTYQRIRGTEFQSLAFGPSIQF